MSPAHVRTRRRWVGPAAAIVALASASPPAKCAAPGGGGLVCEYGVKQALSGRQAEAESAFVSILSRTAGHAAALNNLGNLRILAGDPETALAFYERAARADSGDGGIQLNRSIALLLLDRRDEAERAAESGKKLAGGEEAARRLLGLGSGRKAAAPTRGAEMSARLQAPLVPRSGARRVVVTSEELSSLISGARPATPAPGAKAEEGGAPPRAVAAGNKAAELDSPSLIVYWKC